MKETKYYLLLFLCVISSGSLWSQRPTVTLEFENKPIVEIIQHLRKTSSLSFTYNVEEVQKAGEASINVKNMAIEEVLKQLFEGTKLDFKIEGSSVVITNTQVEKIDISGTVISEYDGRGVPGASVHQKGTSNGTSTDIDGRYVLRVPKGSTIVFSYIGMATQEIKAHQERLDIVMADAVTELKEVVITGYGATRKAAFTGAASVVGEEVVKRQTGANVISNLQGTVPGVQINITSGSPGSSSPMQIRGLGSINAGTSPLYVIDGVPVFSGAYSALGVSGQDVDPLSSLNSEDIESISILKDASATSIYGSRASNGVVIIQTKSGKSGKATIQFNMRVGQTRAAKLRHNFQTLHGEKYMELLNESLIHAGFDPSPEFMEANFDLDLNNLPETDWWDEITKPGLIHEYSASVSGGNDKTKYYTSLGFFQDQGFVIGGGTKRFSGRVNLENKLGKYLTFSNQLSGSFSRTNSISADLTKSNPIALARMLMPVESPYESDGSWNLHTSAKGAGDYGYNPLALYLDPYGDVKTQDAYSFIYSPSLRLQIGKDLFIQTKAGINLLMMDGMAILSMLVNPISIETHKGLNSQTDIQRSTLISTNTIQWMPTFGKHNLNVMIGQEAQQTSAKNVQITGTNFPNYKMVYAIANATERLGSASNYTASAALMSVFANAEYDFNNRYYLSASVRTDGSSRFLGRNRWGTFFSVGAKYRLSEEAFMKSSRSVINNLVLRVSYGTTGNQDVGYYQARGLYSYGNNYDNKPGSVPSQLASSDLTWEKRKKFNVGFDMGLFNRVVLELDYFNDRTTDMLFSVPITQSTGFMSMMKNIGEMGNSGFEGIVNVMILNRSKLRWTVNINFTAYENRILKLAQEEPIIGESSIREVGRPWNQFWLRRFGGVDPQTGEPLFLLADGTLTTDAALANLPENRHYYGTGDPKLYGGFGTRLDAYGFDLSFQFVYRIGGYAFSDENQWGEHTGWNKTSNWTNYVYDNRWKEPGDDAKLPKLVFGKAWDNVQRTEAGLQPLSHLKLRNITLGYTLPKAWTDRMRFQKLRLYVSIDNLFSIYHKDYRGWDADAMGMATASNGYIYPTSTNFIFGLSVQI